MLYARQRSEWMIRSGRICCWIFGSKLAALLGPSTTVMSIADDWCPAPRRQKPHIFSSNTATIIFAADRNRLIYLDDNSCKFLKILISFSPFHTISTNFHWIFHKILRTHVMKEIGPVGHCLTFNSGLKMPLIICAKLMSPKV